MSTLTGQSDLQPLQARHRSKASRTSVERQPVVIDSPRTISNSSRARPRVECSSSRVTMYEGHITCSSLEELRHDPIPTQRRAAVEKRWSSSG